MSAAWMALEIGVNALQSCLFVGFMFQVLTLRPGLSRRRIALCAALTALLLALGLTAYLFVDIPVTDSLLHGLNFALALYLFEEKWYVKLAWAVFVAGAVVLAATLVASLFMDLAGVSWELLMSESLLRLSYLLIANLLLFLLLYTASRLRRRMNRLSLPSLALFLALNGVLLFCLEMQFVLVSAMGVADRGVILTIFCLALVLAGILALFELLSASAERQARMEARISVATLTRRHYGEMKAMYQDTVRRQHDMKHQIDALEAMIAEGNLAGSADYLAKLRRTALPLRYATGCASVDALLSAKTAAMEQRGVAFEYVAYPLNELPIEETLFCALVGNLLDNALEAAERLPEGAPRRVRLGFARTRGVFFITCRNTFDPDALRRRGDEFLSSKRDGRPGLGIPSIRSTVRAAGGNCDFSVDGEWFSAQIELAYGQEAR